MGTDHLERLRHTAGLIAVRGDDASQIRLACHLEDPATVLADLEPINPTDQTPVSN